MGMIPLGDASRHPARIPVVTLLIILANAFAFGLWFLMQVLNAGTVAQVQTGGVAYLAHIGGFIFGAVTARWFEDPRRAAWQTTIEGR